MPSVSAVGDVLIALWRQTASESVRQRAWGPALLFADVRLSGGPHEQLTAYIESAVNSTGWCLEPVEAGRNSLRSARRACTIVEAMAHDDDSVGVADGDRGARPLTAVEDLFGLAPHARERIAMRKLTTALSSDKIGASLGVASSAVGRMFCRTAD